jgi:hypothetical protein
MLPALHATRAEGRAHGTLLLLRHGLSDGNARNRSPGAWTCNQGR